MFIGNSAFVLAWALSLWVVLVPDQVGRWFEHVDFGRQDEGGGLIVMFLYMAWLALPFVALMLAYALMLFLSMPAARRSRKAVEAGAPDTPSARFHRSFTKWSMRLSGWALVALIVATVLAEGWKYVTDSAS